MKKVLISLLVVFFLAFPFIVNASQDEISSATSIFLGPERIELQKQIEYFELQGSSSNNTIFTFDIMIDLNGNYSEIVITLIAENYIYVTLMGPKLLGALYADFTAKKFITVDKLRSGEIFIGRGIADLKTGPKYDTLQKRKLNPNEQLPPEEKSIFEKSVEQHYKIRRHFNVHTLEGLESAIKNCKSPDDFSEADLIAGIARCIKK